MKQIGIAFLAGIVLSGSLLSCSWIGSSGPRPLPETDVLPAVHSTILAELDRSATPPCIPLDLCARGLGECGVWSAALRDSLAQLLDRDGWIVVDGPIVGPVEPFVLIATATTDRLELRVLRPAADTIARFQIVPSPVAAPRSEFAGLECVPGPEVDYEIADLSMGPLGQTALILSPDAARRVTFKVEGTIGTATTIAVAPFGDRCRFSPAIAFGQIPPYSAAISHRPGLSERTVHAPWLELPWRVEVIRTESSERITLTGTAPNAPGLYGSRISWPRQGVGMMLDPAPMGLRDVPIVRWIRPGRSPRPTVVLDADGRIYYGDELGLWAPPTPGFGADIIRFAQSWITTTGGVGADSDTLLSFTIDRHRRLRITDRFPLDAGDVRRLARGDVDGDGHVDLIIVHAVPGGSRYSFLVSGRDTIS